MLALLALWRLPETFGKDLDYLETCCLHPGIEAM